MQTTKHLYLFQLGSCWYDLIHCGCRVPTCGCAWGRPSNALASGLDPFPYNSKQTTAADISIPLSKASPQGLKTRPQTHSKSRLEPFEYQVPPKTKISLRIIKLSEKVIQICKDTGPELCQFMGETSVGTSLALHSHNFLPSNGVEDWVTAAGWVKPTRLSWSYRQSKFYENNSYQWKDVFLSVCGFTSVCLYILKRYVFWNIVWSVSFENWQLSETSQQDINTIFLDWRATSRASPSVLH